MQQVEKLHNKIRSGKHLCFSRKSPHYYECIGGHLRLRRDLLWWPGLCTLSQAVGIYYNSALQINYHQYNKYIQTLNVKNDISEIFEERENSIRVAQKTVIKEFLV